MWQLELEHGSKGEEQDGHVLGGVGDVVGITQMDGGQLATNRTLVRHGAGPTDNNYAPGIQAWTVSG